MYICPCTNCVNAHVILLVCTTVHVLTRDTQALRWHFNIHAHD